MIFSVFYFKTQRPLSLILCCANNSVSVFQFQWLFAAKKRLMNDKFFIVSAIHNYPQRKILFFIRYLLADLWEKSFLHLHVWSEIFYTTTAILSVIAPFHAVRNSLHSQRAGALLFWTAIINAVVRTSFFLYSAIFSITRTHIFRKSYTIYPDFFNDRFQLILNVRKAQQLFCFIHLHISLFFVYQFSSFVVLFQKYRF